MSRKFRTIIALLGVLLCLVTAGTGYGSANAPKECADGILNYLCASSGADCAQKWLDSPDADKFQRPVDWYFLALYQSGEEYDLVTFRVQYSSYVSEKDASASNATWLNHRLLEWAMGFPLPADEKIAERVQGGDIMSLVYGLHLSNNTGGQYVLPESLLERQCEDGGFSLRGDFGDPDVTAMVLEALAPHYGKNPDVNACVDRAVAYLSEAQLPNGGYRSFGTDNSESVSQVIIALSALGIDCRTDARFTKNSVSLFDSLDRFRLESGAYRHAEDGDASEIATAEALCAMVAYERLLTGQGGLYELTQYHLPDLVGPYVVTQIVTKAPDSESNKDNAADTSAASKTKEAIDYRFFAIGGVVLLFCLSLVLLRVLKRFTKRNVLFAALVAVAFSVFFILTDFESVSKHYEGYDVENPVGTVTLTIRCDTVAGEGNLPKDGVILADTECPIEEGDVAFAVLERVTKRERIAMDYTGGGTSVYVKGIADLYEFSFGEMSGWIYRINGVTMPVGCGSATVKPGDRIEFLYTRMLGEDLE